MKTTSLIMKSGLLLMLMCFIGTMQAQEAITILGGDVSANGASLSLSAGQVAVKSSVARAITVVNITEQFSEGVQQPRTSRDPQNSIEALDVNVAIYPNPTTDAVVMECRDLAQDLTYTLYNLNGQILQEGSFAGGQQHIDLQHYSAGSYMLYVSSSDKKQMNTYKIIKAK